MCPNIGECWNHGTATFMIMGSVCTRACRFCAVDTGNPNGWLDKKEPSNIAQAVILLCTKDNMFQRFLIEGDRLKDYQNKFLEKVEQFYAQRIAN